MVSVIASDAQRWDVELERWRSALVERWDWPSPEAGFMAYVAGGGRTPPFPLGSLALAYADRRRLHEAPVLAAVGYALAVSALDGATQEDWSRGFARLARRDAFPSDRGSFVYQPLELLGICVGAMRCRGVAAESLDWLRGVLLRRDTETRSDQVWPRFLGVIASHVVSRPWDRGPPLSLPTATIADLALLLWLCRAYPGLAVAHGLDAGALLAAFRDRHTFGGALPRDTAQMVLQWTALRSLSNAETAPADAPPDAAEGRNMANAASSPVSTFPLAVDSRSPLMPRTDPEILFAWAHLADLQFRGSGGPAGHQMVLAALRNDLAAAKAYGCPSLDAILVTGDMAHGGAEDQYAEASRWLLDVAMTTGVARESVYVVPGNHDVDWNVARDRNVARLVRSLREGDEALDDALAHDRELLVRPLEHYITFAAGFAPACGEPFWVQKIDTRTGLHLRLVGLATALLSAPPGDDRGKLRVGFAQLAAGLAGLRPDELVVVLSHHPFSEGWLADQTDADAWVRNHAHLHLFAHVNEHDSEQARSGAGGAFVRVSAGITYAGGPSQDGHGYNIAAVVRTTDGAVTLRLWPRRWSDRIKGFRADTDALPEGSAYTEHPLRLVIPRAAAAPVVSEPLRVVPSPTPATTPPVAQRATTHMTTPGRPLDLGIVVALPEELRELLDLAAPYEPHHDADLDSYLFERGPYRCAAALVGDMGEVQAARVTERLIALWDPGSIVVVGIAAGVHDDLRVGDVHVASQAVQYIQDAKAAATASNGFTIVPGAPAYRADYALLAAVRRFEFSHRESYQRWVSEGRADLNLRIPDAAERARLFADELVRPDVRLLADGHVATGPVVGAAAAFSTWIRTHDRNVKALEMESAAVLLAAQTRGAPKRALAIRGISDFGNDRKLALDRIGGGVLRQYAMRNAVRLLLALLDAGALPREGASQNPR